MDVNPKPSPRGELRYEEWRLKRAEAGKKEAPLQELPPLFRDDGSGFE